MPPGFAEAVEAPPQGAVRSRPCARGPPGRGHAERSRRHRPPLGRRARSLATLTWSGAGSRRRPTGRAGGWATPTCIITWEEDSIRLATAPGLLHKESSRVRDRGDHTRHRPLVCEAIDTAARRYPYHDRRDDPPTLAGDASTPLSSSPSIWGDMRSSLPRAGPGAPGRKPAGATLKEREGLPDGPPPQEARPPGILPPRSTPVRTIRGSPTPPRGHRTPGELDQEHRATRQPARDTAFKAARDTPSSPHSRPHSQSPLAYRRPNASSTR